MNIYRYTFIAACPCNGEQIVYLLELQHADMVRVEHIKTACALHRQGYQEDIAADLYQRFGGRLTLRATHHGVDIETTLGNTPCFKAVPRNATLYDPDEVAFPTQRCADGVDALPPELASTAAAKKGGQHGAG